MVAGASKGIGYGIAQILAQEGCKVSIGSRTDDDIKTAAQQIQTETGSDILGFPFDATVSQSISDWVAATKLHFGRVDYLVVNSGGPPAGLFDDFDDDAWQSAFELNLLSAVRMIRVVLPIMRECGGRSILVITSSSVKEPIDMLLLSNVMRAGVAGLAKTLSRTLVNDNIRINNIVPGRIDTDRVGYLDAATAKKKGISESDQRKLQEAMIPMGRYGSVHEFGRVAAFILSDAASYINGATIVVDGGKIRSTN